MRDIPRQPDKQAPPAVADEIKKEGERNDTKKHKKEARETRYWLKLLRDTNTNFESELEVLLNESEQIINILTRRVKTSIANQNKKSLTL